MVKLNKQNTNYQIDFENEKYFGNGNCTCSNKNNYFFNLSISQNNEYIGNISYQYNNGNESISYNCNRKYISDFNDVIDEVINEMTFE